MDQPASTCYKELLRRNPKAKVILTVRDPEKWFKSASETIFKFETFHHNTWFLWLFPRTRYIRDGIAGCVSIPVYGGYKSYRNKELCIKVYKDHVEEVKRTVPADQLLLFEVCGFLSVSFSPGDPSFPDYSLLLSFPWPN